MTTPSFHLAITGAGLAIEDRARGGFAGLIREAAAAGAHPWIAGESDPEQGLPSAKDRKILSGEDVLAARAAMAAVDEAFPAGIPAGCEVGCVTFGCGKATRAAEREAPYVGFRKADHGIDSAAFAEAVAAARVQVDPLRLLRDLNNNVVWWLCKQLGLGGVNLQLSQLDAPDLWTLIYAVELLERGSCEAVLVGGVQTTEQSAVQATVRRGAFCAEGDPSVGGAALFFVVQRLAAPEPRAAAELRLRLDAPHLPAMPPGTWGTPALEHGLEVYRACLAARAAGKLALIELGRPA